MDVPVKQQGGVEAAGAATVRSVDVCRVWAGGAHTLFQDCRKENVRRFRQTSEDIDLVAGSSGGDPQPKNRQDHQIRQAQELLAKSPQIRPQPLQ